MTTKQITVFIENRKGRLGEVLDVFKLNGVNIFSLSLADTAEYGLLRLITDKPEEAKIALSETGYSSVISDVFIIKLPHTPGSLQTVLRVMGEEKLNVEYMYGLSFGGREASIVLKTSDERKAEEIFAKHGIVTLSGTELQSV